MLKPDGTYFKGIWKYNIFSEGGILYPNGEFFVKLIHYFILDWELNLWIKILCEWVNVLRSM